MEITAREIAELVGGAIDGDGEVVVCGVATVEDAKASDIVLADGEAFYRKATDCQAVCILTGRNGFAVPAGKTLIRAGNPLCAFARVLEMFAESDPHPLPGIGTGAVVEPGVRLGTNVAIGANCYVGANATIGDHAVLFPNVYVGAGVTIGVGCIVHPNSTIYHRCHIGDHTILHAGTVVGADGFGFKACAEKVLVKFPHIGDVVIGNDVEIGANSTIDRAKTGSTVIGDGTKIDNLVHIAHNVKIGPNCIIVAQTGIAGSVHIGEGVTMAAQVGVKDHVTIGAGATLAARSGVIGDVKPGSVVSGFPARDHGLDMRAEAARLRLPELLKRMRELEKDVKYLMGVDDEVGSGSLRQNAEE